MKKKILFAGAAIIVAAVIVIISLIASSSDEPFAEEKNMTPAEAFEKAPPREKMPLDFEIKFGAKETGKVSAQ